MLKILSRTPNQQFLRLSRKIRHSHRHSRWFQTLLEQLLPDTRFLSVSVAYEFTEVFLYGLCFYDGHRPSSNGACLLGQEIEHTGLTGHCYDAVANLLIHSLALPGPYMREISTMLRITDAMFFAIVTYIGKFFMHYLTFVLENYQQKNFLCLIASRPK